MSTVVTRNRATRGVSPFISDQLWLMSVLAAGLFVFAMATVVVVSRFRDIQISAWEIFGTAAPWYVAVMSAYLAFYMVPLYVANGRTRTFAFREWVTAGVGISLVGALLMTVGYHLENVVYRIADFPGRPSSDNLFNSINDIHVVLVQHLLVFAVWFALGGFVGASLYRSPDIGWLSIPVAFFIVWLSGTSLSDSGPLGIVRVIYKVLPERSADSLLLWSLIAMAAAAAGLALTWRVTKDVSLRNP